MYYNKKVFYNKELSASLDQKRVQQNISTSYIILFMGPARVISYQTALKQYFLREALAKFSKRWM